MPAMSWGYFLDLDLTLPTPAWKRLAHTKTGSHGITPGWWGFKKAELGTMFTAADFDDHSIGEAVELFSGAESIGMIYGDLGEDS